MKNTKQPPKKRQISERLKDLIESGVNPYTEVDELRTTSRTFNCLNRNAVKTIYDLMHWTDNDLLHLPNFGRKCLLDLNLALDEFMRRCVRDDVYVWVNENLGLVKIIRDASINEPVLLMPFMEKIK